MDTVWWNGLIESPMAPTSTMATAPPKDALTSCFHKKCTRPWNFVRKIIPSFRCETCATIWIPINFSSFSVFLLSCSHCLRLSFFSLLWIGSAGRYNEVKTQYTDNGSEKKWCNLLPMHYTQPWTKHTHTHSFTLNRPNHILRGEKNNNFQIMIYLKCCE